MLEPGGERLDDGGGVRFRIERHIIAFEGSHESFRHAVGLRAFNWRAQRKEADLTRKPTRVGRRVARAVVGQPFDSLGQPVETTEALLDSRDHQIADILAFDARRCHNMAHGLSIAAVERLTQSASEGAIWHKDTITVSIDQDGRNALTSLERHEVTEALKEWSEASGKHFVVADNNASANISIGLGNLDTKTTGLCSRLDASAPVS